GGPDGRASARGARLAVHHDLPDLAWRRGGDRKPRGRAPPDAHRPGVEVKDGAMPQPANQNRHLVTAIPGPRSQALRAREDEHLAPGAQGYALMAGVVVDHAEGTQVTDVDGNQLLDFIGGIAVGALGHSHPTWVEAIQRQAG